MYRNRTLFAPIYLVKFVMLVQQIATGQISWSIHLRPLVSIGSRKGKVEQRRVRTEEIGQQERDELGPKSKEFMYQRLQAFEETYRKVCRMYVM